MRAQCDRELALNRLPLPRLWPRDSSIKRQTLHPGVDVRGAIDFPGLVDFCIGGYRFFYEAANLFLIRGMPFDGLDDQTMRGTSSLLGECAKTGA
jgi:hypothetical protein